MQIFISYASKNRDIVEKLAEDLTDLGHGVWFDKQLSGGQEWWTSILDQVRQCELFIFALTEQSLESKPCRLEYQYASQLRKHILPVIVGDVNTALLPPELAVIQFVDYRSEDKKAAIALNRALNLLPAAQLLPDPLPQPPSAPVSPLSELRAQINAPSLDANEQRLLVVKIADFLKDADTADDARSLLLRLRRRADLLATADREIGYALQGKATRRIQPRLLVIHGKTINQAAFAPDGHRIIAACEHSTVYIWDAISGEELDNFKLGTHEYSAKIGNFSADGNLVILQAINAGIVLWNIETGSEDSRFELPHDFRVFDATISPDGHYVLAAGRFPDIYDENDNIVDKDNVILWDLSKNENYQFRVPVPHNLGIGKIQFSSDGRQVLILDTSNHRNEVLFLNPVNWTIINGLSFNNYVWDATFSPDGKHIGVLLASELDQGQTWSFRGEEFANKLWRQTALICDASNGFIVRELRFNISQQHSGKCEIKFSADGRSVIVRLEDATLRMWRKDERSIFIPTNSNFIARSEEYWDISPDGDFVLADDGIGILRIGPSVPQDYIYQQNSYSENS